MTEIQPSTSPNPTPIPLGQTGPNHLAARLSQQSLQLKPFVTPLAANRLSRLKMLRVRTLIRPAKGSIAEGGAPVPFNFDGFATSLSDWGHSDLPGFESSASGANIGESHQQSPVHESTDPRVEERSLSALDPAIDFPTPALSADTGISHQSTEYPPSLPTNSVLSNQPHLSQSKPQELVSPAPAHNPQPQDTSHRRDRELSYPSPPGTPPPSITSENAPSEPLISDDLGTFSNPTPTLADDSQTFSPLEHPSSQPVPPTVVASPTSASTLPQQTSLSSGPSASEDGVLAKADNISSPFDTSDRISAPHAENRPDNFQPSPEQAHETADTVLEPPNKIDSPPEQNSEVSFPNAATTAPPTTSTSQQITASPLTESPQRFSEVPLPGDVAQSDLSPSQPSSLNLDTANQPQADQPSTQKIESVTPPDPSQHNPLVNSHHSEQVSVVNTSPELERLEHEDPDSPAQQRQAQSPQSEAPSSQAQQTVNDVLKAATAGNQKTTQAIDTQRQNTEANSPPTAKQTHVIQPAALSEARSIATDSQQPQTQPNVQNPTQTELDSEPTSQTALESSTRAVSHPGQNSENAAQNAQASSSVQPDENDHPEAQHTPEEDPASPSPVQNSLTTEQHNSSHPPLDIHPELTASDAVSDFQSEAEPQNISPELSPDAGQKIISTDLPEPAESLNLNPSISIQHDQPSSHENEDISKTETTANSPFSPQSDTPSKAPIEERTSEIPAAKYSDIVNVDRTTLPASSGSSPELPQATESLLDLTDIQQEPQPPQQQAISEPTTPTFNKTEGISPASSSIPQDLADSIHHQVETSSNPNTTATPLPLQEKTEHNPTHDQSSLTPGTQRHEAEHPHSGEPSNQEARSPEHSPLLIPETNRSATDALTAKTNDDQTLESSANQAGSDSLSRATSGVEQQASERVASTKAEPEQRIESSQKISQPSNNIPTEDVQNPEERSFIPAEKISASAPQSLDRYPSKNTETEVPVPAPTLSRNSSIGGNGQSASTDLNKNVQVSSQRHTADEMGTQTADTQTANQEQETSDVVDQDIVQTPKSRQRVIPTQGTSSLGTNPFNDDLQSQPSEQIGFPAASQNIPEDPLTSRETAQLSTAPIIPTEPIESQSQAGKKAPQNSSQVVSDSQNLEKKASIQRETENLDKGIIAAPPTHPVAPSQPVSPKSGPPLPTELNSLPDRSITQPQKSPAFDLQHPEHSEVKDQSPELVSPTHTETVQTPGPSEFFDQPSENTSSETLQTIEDISGNRDKRIPDYEFPPAHSHRNDGKEALDLNLTPVKESHQRVEVDHTPTDSSSAPIDESAIPPNEAHPTHQLDEQIDTPGTTVSSSPNAQEEENQNVPHSPQAFSETSSTPTRLEDLSHPQVSTDANPELSETLFADISASELVQPNLPDQAKIQDRSSPAQETEQVEFHLLPEASSNNIQITDGDLRPTDQINAAPTMQEAADRNQSQRTPHPSSDSSPSADGVIPESQSSAGESLPSIVSDPSSASPLMEEYQKANHQAQAANKQSDSHRQTSRLPGESQISVEESSTQPSDLSQNQDTANTSSDPSQNRKEFTPDTCAPEQPATSALESPPSVHPLKEQPETETLSSQADPSSVLDTPPSAEHFIQPPEFQALDTPQPITDAAFNPLVQCSEDHKQTPDELETNTPHRVFPDPLVADNLLRPEETEHQRTVQTNKSAPNTLDRPKSQSLGENASRLRPETAISETRRLASDSIPGQSTNDVPTVESRSHTTGDHPFDSASDASAPIFQGEGLATMPDRFRSELEQGQNHFPQSVGQCDEGIESAIPDSIKVGSDSPLAPVKTPIQESVLGESINQPVADPDVNGVSPQVRSEEKHHHHVDEFPKPDSDQRDTSNTSASIPEPQGQDGLPPEPSQPGEHQALRTPIVIQEDPQPPSLSPQHPEHDLLQPLATDPLTSEIVAPGTIDPDLDRTLVIAAVEKQTNGVLARLAPGEFVVKAAEAEAHQDLLQHLNSGGDVTDYPGAASQAPPINTTPALPKILKPLPTQGLLTPQVFDAGGEVKNSTPSNPQGLSTRDLNHLLTAMDLQGFYKGGQISDSQAPAHQHQDPRDTELALLSKGDFVVNATDAKANLELLQQINCGEEPNLYTDPSMQWTSLEELLAEDSDQEQGLNITVVEADVSPTDPAEEGVEAAENISQIIAKDAGLEVTARDLEILVGMICDRISPLLTIEQERQGLTQYAIWQAAPQTAQLQPLEKLTLNMTNRIQQRLEIEQERQGFNRGRLSW